MRVHLRRTMTGEWLHHNAPVTLQFTDTINGRNRATGSIPAAFDVPAEDGFPMWLERGTTAYIEDDDGTPVWNGLCSYSAPGKTSRQIELGGVLSLYDLIEYDGVAYVWQPDPFDVVEGLLANGNLQPHGSLALTVVRDAPSGAFVGDAVPPTPRPVKPVRGASESRDDYQDRLFAWQFAVDDWDALYADRAPYSVTWWQHQYIGDEIRRLADTVPFQVTEVAAAGYSPELHLGPPAGTTRDDLRLSEGLNLVGDIAPSTNANIYGNDIWVLGAGDGAATLRGRVSDTYDGRVRTTRVFDDKTITNQATLDAMAAKIRSLSGPAAVLATAQAREHSLDGLRPGDFLPVESRLFTGLCRVLEITRSTAGGPIQLAFDTGDSST